MICWHNLYAERYRHAYGQRSNADCNFAVNTFGLQCTVEGNAVGWGRGTPEHFKGEHSSSELRRRWWRHSRPCWRLCHRHHCHRHRVASGAVTYRIRRLTVRSVRDKIWNRPYMLNGRCYLSSDLCRSL